jgi:ABC-2 type transport system permease protein
MNLDPRRALAVLRIQCKEFLRDFGGVFLSIVFPLLFAAALVASNLISPGFVFTFGVVDPHRNADTAALVSALASPSVSFRTVDEAAGRAGLNDGKLHALIVLPRAPLHDGQGDIELVTDARSAGLSTMALDAARARLLLGAGGHQQGYAVRLTTFEKPAESNFAFIFPGMLALALVQLGLFSTATPLLKARERGTLRYMLLTPLTVPELLLGQIGLRVLISLVQVSLLLAVGAFVVQLNVITWLALAALSTLGVAMLVSIGYALAGLPRSMESGMALIMIANFVMMFGGNIFWDPTGSLVLGTVAHALPASYLADAYRQVISGRQGLWPMWVDIAAMLLWTLAATAVAVRTFSFDMQRRQRGADEGAPGGVHVSPRQS